MALRLHWPDRAGRRAFIIYAKRLAVAPVDSKSDGGNRKGNPAGDGSHTVNTEMSQRVASAGAKGSAS